MNTTPLRYPGGKSIITPLIEDIIEQNGNRDIAYAEPYAGGAGAALNLITKGVVEKIMINDACVGIYSFWHFLLEKSEEFLDLFDNTEVNLDEWQKQRTIFKTVTKPTLKLGFATFFLSRCNRSGILYAGPMGGQDIEMQKQAKDKIDCRFNKHTLRKQLSNIIKLKDKIIVSNEDALVFLQRISNDNILVYIDPPYYEKGKQLYMNFYVEEDHRKLADFLRISHMKWILSYDNVFPICKLYAGFQLYEFSLTYSVQVVRQGSEMFTHSLNLKMPKPLQIRTTKKHIPLHPIEGME